MSKICSKCKLFKPENEFYTRKRNNKIFLENPCKKCYSHIHSFYYKKNINTISKWRSEYGQKNKISLKYKRIKNNYGISAQSFEDLRKSQDFKCKICYKEEGKEFWKTLYIDHCHKNGKIRGLLCNSCNRALGLFKENPQILKNTIIYLCNTQYPFTYFRKNTKSGINKYNIILRKQNYRCAICYFLPTKDYKFSLSIDHDHASNMVRGLLCNNCNRGLGLVKESSLVISKMINYLEPK